MFATDVPEPIILSPDFTRWTLAQRLEREFSAIGFHLSGHPLDEFEDIFAASNVSSWLEIEQSARDGDTAGRIAGIVVSRNNIRTRKGKPMSILTLSDPSGSFECVMFSEQIAQYGEYLEQGMSAILDVEADARPEGVRLRLLGARPLDKTVQPVQQKMTIYVNDKNCLAPVKTLLQAGGNGQVFVRVHSFDRAREYELKLKGKFHIDRDLVGGVKSISGVNDVQLG